MRNDLTFNQVPHSSVRVWSLLKSLGMEQLGALPSTSPLASYATQSQPGVFDCSPGNTSTTSWINPDTGWFKVNVDGALSAMFSASCGGVIRDASGNWVKGFSRNLGIFSSAKVFLTELVAVRTGVELAMSLDLANVIIETDSMEVVEVLLNSEGVTHRYEQVILDILRLQSAHGSLLFQHAPRTANSLADYLARIGFELPYGSHYFDSPFGECHAILQQDHPPIVGPSVGRS